MFSLVLDIMIRNEQDQTIKYTALLMKSVITGDEISLNRSLSFFLKQVDDTEWPREIKDIVKNLIIFSFIKGEANVKKIPKSLVVNVARLLLTKYNELIKRENFASLLPLNGTNLLPLDIDQIVDWLNSKGTTRFNPELLLPIRQILGFNWRDIIGENIMNDQIVYPQINCMIDLLQEGFRLLLPAGGENYQSEAVPPAYT